MSAYDADKGVIEFGDSKKKDGHKKFAFPKNVIAPEATQSEVFELMMRDHISTFLNGYSLNVLAYGQTGTGKTYTMISPVGTFKKMNASKNVEEIPDEFGLFIRTVLIIFN